MDPFSDSPLVYRRTEGGFTLYSVGGGFADDGGHVKYTSSGEPVRGSLDEGTDIVYWPVAERREPEH